MNTLTAQEHPSVKCVGIIDACGDPYFEAMELLIDLKEKFPIATGVFLKFENRRSLYQRIVGVPCTRTMNIVLTFYPPECLREFLAAYRALEGKSKFVINVGLIGAVLARRLRMMV
jgi:hypothetical protein